MIRGRFCASEGDGALMRKTQVQVSGSGEMAGDGASKSDPGEVCKMMRDGEDVCTFLLPPELPWGFEAFWKGWPLTISFRPRWCSMISHLNDSWKLPISFRISQLAIFDDTGMFSLSILTRTWPCQSTASTEQPSEAGSRVQYGPGDSYSQLLAALRMW